MNGSNILSGCGDIVRRVLEVSRMSHLEKSIVINVPVRVAYNQWTQFEEFRYFMEGVIDVQQLDDRHLHWRTNVGGMEKEFDAEITEQLPDQRIAWKSISGSRHSGVVTFHRLDDNRSKLTVQMEVEPDGVVETVGDWIGVVSSQVTEDLEKFKEFIETRQTETGAWRGEVHQQS